MNPEMKERDCTERLADALNALSILKAEWQSLQQAKREAVDWDELVRFRHLEKTLSLDLCAAYARVLRLQGMAGE